MKPSLKLIGILFFLYSCKTQPAEGIIVPDVIKKVNSFSPADTLNKYASSDILNTKGEKVFYAGTTNEKAFGLIQATDTAFLVLQKDNSAWSISDTLPLSDIVDVNYKDLNGDAYNDIIIIQNYTGAGGNSQNVVLLFDTGTNSFIHNHFYDLPNIQCDKSKKLIYSAWWGSANHIQEKMVYRILNDSLTFENGVTYIPDEEGKGNIGMVEFYIYRNTKRIVTKKMRGKATETFTVFSKAFWNTDKE